MATPNNLATCRGSSAVVFDGSANIDARDMSQRPGAAMSRICADVSPKKAIFLQVSAALLQVGAMFFQVSATFLQLSAALLQVRTTLMQVGAMFLQVSAALLQMSATFLQAVVAQRTGGGVIQGVGGAVAGSAASKPGR